MSRKRRSNKIGARTVAAARGDAAAEAFVGWARNAWAEEVLAQMQRLSIPARARIERYAARVLRVKELKRDEDLRIGAARVMTALLPKTFAVFEDLLNDRTSPLWYEVHFSLLAQFWSSGLSEDVQKRVTALVKNYLSTIRSSAGFAAWKAGNLLGDWWYSEETVRILEHLAISAKYAAGRMGALQGIDEALQKASPSEKARLLSLLARMASKDRSTKVRTDSAIVLNSRTRSRRGAKS